MKTLFEILQLMTNRRRTLWVETGLPRPESLADHSYGVILLAYNAAIGLINEGVEVNLERVLEMALLHDLHEAVLGDITRTQEAFLFDRLEDSITYSRGIVATTFSDTSYVLTVLEELQYADTIEAKIVKDADKADFNLTLKAYRSIYGSALDEIHEL